jgi:hypothetical protein
MAVRAAVIREAGGTPRLEQFVEPDPHDELRVAERVAAGLNPLDLVIASRRLPTSSARGSVGSWL